MASRSVSRREKGSKRNTHQVKVDEVIPLPSEQEEKTAALCHPAVISLSKETEDSNTKDVNLRLLQRKRKGDSDSNPSVDVKLHASVNGHAWDWYPAHNNVAFDYYIGVRNKKANTLQLIQSHGSYIPRPSINASKRRRVQHELKDGQTNDQVQNYKEQRKLLLDSFGSKRTIQRLSKYERDRITDEKLDEKTTVNLNIAAKKMIEKDAQEGITHTDFQTAEASAPPHDSKATRLEDAYPFVGLVTPTELMALEQEANATLEAFAPTDHANEPNTVENPGWHPLVWDRLLLTIKDQELSQSTRLIRMQAAMHIHYLTVLAKEGNTITIASQSRMMEEMAVNENVLRCILERFTVEDVERPKSRRRFKTPKCVDILLNYAVIMWITACGYTGCDSIGQLATAMNVSTKRLVANAIGLGCKVRKNNTQTGPEAYRISIKVPLVFPPIKKRKGRPEKRR